MMTVKQRVSILLINTCYWIMPINALADASEPEAAAEKKPAPAGAELPRYTLGIQASQITGTGLFIRQNLDRKTQLQYVLWAKAKLKDTDVGNSTQKTHEMNIDLGLSYRKYLLIRPITQGIFKQAHLGYFVGGNIANRVGADSTDETSDSNLRTYAAGGGAFVGIRTGSLEYELSAGIHGRYSFEDAYLRRFGDFGRETYRLFAPGFGFSLAYTF